MIKTKLCNLALSAFPKKLKEFSRSDSIYDFMQIKENRLAFDECENLDDVIY